MSLVINTNTASINAQRNLGLSKGTLNTSMARLSSGMRITSAKDDAAGLAISEKLRANIRGLGQAERNANDGISMIQTAEGALNEVSNMLIRQKELAVQAANGTLGADERGYLQAEYSQLDAEITRISTATEFNGTALFGATIDLQVGVNAADTISFTVGTLAATGGDISTAAGASTALGTIDTAIGTVSGTRGDLGAAQNRLQSTVNNLAVQRENLSAANSRIRDVDVAQESVEMTRSQILMQAGIAVLAQSNQLPAMALSLIG